MNFHFINFAPPTDHQKVYEYWTSDKEVETK